MNLDEIDDIRAFNRFYTRQIGLLSEGLHKSEFSLTEARVLFELNAGGPQIVGKLATILDLDPAYLSRILTRFKKIDLITLRADSNDRRIRIAELTDSGKMIYATLEDASRRDIAGLIGALPQNQRDELRMAMQTIQTLLSPKSPALSDATRYPVIIRDHRAGDLGWIVHRHGALYTAEYNWDTTFEGMVAEIAAGFLAKHDSACEGCWIAEHKARIAGSIMLVRQSDTVARLRLLYVEPEARGMGIGGHLVDHCIVFARRAGYKQITLWTNANLYAARHIYEKAGFVLTSEEPHHSFGHNLIGQTWLLDL